MTSIHTEIKLALQLPVGHLSDLTEIRPATEMKHMAA
jgi:hypothetical protein